MPFDLVRPDMLINLKPLRPKRISSIIDELFLPLLQSYQAPPASTRATTTGQGQRGTGSKGVARGAAAPLGIIHQRDCGKARGRFHADSGHAV
jgi:hypothetical protein